MSGTVKHIFFSARKEKKGRKEKALTKPPRFIWAGICCTRNENPRVQLPFIYLTIFFFLPFDRKRYSEATNNCTRKSTRHTLFDANQHTLVKQCGCFFFFHQRKKWLHQNVLCWRKYELIFVALYILQMTIRKRKLSLIRKMLLPFDHKQYVEADIRQLRSKISRRNFFHKNQHLKYQAFSKACWQHDRYIPSTNQSRNCFFLFRF